MSISRTFAMWFSNYTDHKSPGARLRARRIAPFLAMIESVFHDNGHVNIVDIGGTEEYWGIIPKQYLITHNVSITILNLPEEHIPTTDSTLFKHVEGDGCNLKDFADKSFNIAHSNSVIEHVGDWERMVRFAAELSRVAQKYFVQTPNYWFPIEPHCMMPFVHWLPKPLRISLISHFRMGNWLKAKSLDEAVRISESARLLTKPMFQELFKDAHILTERFLWLPKSFIALRQ